MSRHLLGIIGLAMLLAGLIGFVGFGGGNSVATGETSPAGIGIRVGLLLCVLWMAYPELVKLAQRVPKWMFGLILVGGAVAFYLGRRSLVIIIPAALVLGALKMAGWFLKPDRKRKTAKRREVPREKEIERQG